MSRTSATRKRGTKTRRRARSRKNGAGPLRFVTADTARVFYAPWGKHWCLSEPGLTGTTSLALFRVTMPPGAGHQFHTHPELDEIIYVVDGVAEQWVDRETRRLSAGESAYIPKNVVHATYNPTDRPLTFLAILSPAASKGPFVVDCCNADPWRSLRTPLVQREVDPRTGV
jgi:quercetin dioxygenase-like cupin family protein